MLASVDKLDPALIAVKKRICDRKNVRYLGETFDDSEEDQYDEEDDHAEGDKFVGRLLRSR